MSAAMIGYIALLLAACLASYVWLSAQLWPESKARLTGGNAVAANVFAALASCVLFVWPAIFACWLVGLALGVLLGRLP